MAKKEEKSTAAKAKAARVKASGTKKINVRKQRSIVQELTLDKQPVGRNARVLSKAGKVIKVTAKQGMGGPYDEKAKVKRVDLDAYDILAKKAKAAGLKGKDAEVAISKAIKGVSSRMKNDRQRTASRGEFIARRERKKRQNTDLS